MKTGTTNPNRKTAPAPGGAQPSASERACRGAFYALRVANAGTDAVFLNLYHVAKLPVYAAVFLASVCAATFEARRTGKPVGVKAGAETYWISPDGSTRKEKEEKDSFAWIVWLGVFAPWIFSTGPLKKGGASWRP